MEAFAPLLASSPSESPGQPEFGPSSPPFPFITLAAARRSSMRAFVQLPMKDHIEGTSVRSMPGFKPI